MIGANISKLNGNESTDDILANGLKRHLNKLIAEEPIDFKFRKAADSGDLAKIKELWSKDIVNIQGDSSGQTALHRAAAKGHTAIVEWLLSHSADPRIPDFKGNTAYLLAANHPETQAVLANHPQAKLAQAWSDMHKHLLQVNRDLYQDFGKAAPDYDPTTDCLKVYKGIKKNN